MRRMSAQTVGATIRRLREQRGWSMGQFAAAIGWEGKGARSNVDRLEKGKINPRLDTLEKIAQALGVNMADLLSASGLDQMAVRDE